MFSAHRNYKTIFKGFQDFADKRVSTQSFSAFHQNRHNILRHHYTVDKNCIKSRSLGEKFEQVHMTQFAPDKRVSKS